MAVVYERNQLEALELFTAAYREYMQMQYRGLPLDLLISAEIAKR
jgi:hypothetical protein